MSQARRIRALIVDDETLGRKRIRTMLRGDTEIEVVGECADGQSAVAAVEEQAPDLIFLDVQMPGMDGFAVLAALPAGRPLPQVIFVTAYDQYAVRAFEVRALDYLLKPFDQKRFESAITRAKQQILAAPGDGLNQQALSLLEELKTKPGPLSRLVIKTGERMFFLKTEDIDWIQAEDNYVRLHTGKQSYLLRETLSNLEGQLDPKRFLRIHRSTMVNIDRIQELQPWFNREFRVVLTDGTQLAMSRRYRERLPERLGSPIESVRRPRFKSYRGISE